MLNCLSLYSTHHVNTLRHVLARRRPSSDNAPHAAYACSHSPSTYKRSPQNPVHSATVTSATTSIDHIRMIWTDQLTIFRYANYPAPDAARNYISWEFHSHFCYSIFCANCLRHFRCCCVSHLHPENECARNGPNTEGKYASMLPMHSHRFAVNRIRPPNLPIRCGNWAVNSKSESSCVLFWRYAVV